MHKSRRELLDDFVQFMGEANDVEARNVAERLLNRSMTAIWLKHPWAQFRSPAPFQLTLTVNQSRYALPDYFGRLAPPGALRNLSRSGCPIWPRSPGALESDYPRTGTVDEVAGSPQAFEIVGVCGAHTQPLVTGEALEVLSSDNGDTDVVVAITGDDANGRWTRNQVPLIGQSAVAIGTWSFIDEIAKAYVATATPATELTSSRGNVTLRKASVDHTELQKLFPQESAKEHAVLALYPKPNAADVIAVPIIRRPKRLFHDADPIPDLWEPAVWEEMAIEWGCNTGNIRRENAGSVPRPAFLDLVCFDNETSRGRAARTVPFGMQ